MLNQLIPVIAALSSTHAHSGNAALCSLLPVFAALFFFSILALSLGAMFYVHSYQFLLLSLHPLHCEIQYLLCDLSFSCLIAALCIYW